jgi:Amt family ammonium transporter
MASRRIALISLIIVLQFFLLPLGILADDASRLVSMDQLLPILHALTWLLPLGVALVAVGITETSRAYHVAISLPLALVAALLGYYLCGYAFQFGGVGLVSDNPGLARLLAEWSPLDLRGSPGWGVIGLRGFMFSLDVVSEQELLLFVSQLALVTTAALIPLTTLSGRIPRTLDFILALLVSCICFPLVGNWVRGGGWLSQLGMTLGFGHGFVDYGLGYVYLVGGCAAFASLERFWPSSAGWW